MSFGYPCVATSAFLPVASGFSFQAVNLHVLPEEGEDKLSVTMDIGLGLRLEFSSRASAFSDSSGVRAESYMSIHILDASDVGTKIAEVSTSSPDSPASSVVWIASTVEHGLKTLGIDHEPLDMALLAEASGRAFRTSTSRTVAVFASFFVSRVGHAEAAEIWQTAEIRAVMNG